MVGYWWLLIACGGRNILSFDVVHLSVNCVVNNFILFGTGVEIKILMGMKWHYILQRLSPLKTALTDFIHWGWYVSYCQCAIFTHEYTHNKSTLMIFFLVTGTWDYSIPSHKCYPLYFLMIHQAEKTWLHTPIGDLKDLCNWDMFTGNIYWDSLSSLEVRTLVVRLKELLFNLTVLQSRDAKTWPDKSLWW